MRSSLSRFAALALVSTVAVAAPAAAEWREASTDHFLIYADSGEDWLRGFADRLERFDATLRLQTRIANDAQVQRSNRVVVFILPSVDAVQRLYGRSDSVAGFYIPRVGNSVAYVGRTVNSSDTRLTSETILFHEYAHHFMLANSHIVYPKWMTEGFAEFASTAAVKRDGAVEIGRPAGHRAYGLLESARMSVERLLDPPKPMNDDMVDVFYGRSWMLTHMLTFDRSRAGQLNKYLTLINAGKTNVAAAQEAFGDLKLLNRQLDAYADKSLTSLTIDAARIKTGPITVRALSAGEGAMMPVRMRSARGVNKQQALAIVADARKRAAPFASDPAVQVALAEAEYDAGNDAEADAAADRALAAEPASQQALLYKGRVAIRRADADAAADSKAWRDARAWFVKANRADPNAAEPSVLFYRSFAAQGVAPTANAAAGLLRAFELSPHDRGLRMQVAYQLLNDDKKPEARQALLPLAFDPHNRGEGNFAARLVEMIDRGEPAAKIVAERPKAAAGEAGAERPD